MKTNGNTDDLYPREIEDLSTKDEALLYDNGPDSPAERHSNGAVKGVAWLFGIVAIFAVAILLTWIVGNHSPVADRSADRQAYATAQAQKSIHDQLSATAAQKANYQFIALLTSGNEASSGNAAATKVKTSSGNATDASALSEADEARIEREAREVIHGDFGDNPGRKARLGADYAAVQARVNEILN